MDITTLVKVEKIKCESEIPQQQLIKYVLIPAVITVIVHTVTLDIHYWLGGRAGLLKRN
jgi:hypothetical protein